MVSLKEKAIRLLKTNLLCHKSIRQMEKGHAFIVYPVTGHLFVFIVLAAIVMPLLKH